MSLPTFSFERSDVDASVSALDVARDPPARELLPASSSLEIIVSGFHSQESVLPNSRLKPLDLYLDNPFEGLDFSFSKDVLSISLSSSDPVMKAQNTITNLVKSSPDTWDINEIGNMERDFQVILDIIDDDAGKKIIIEFRAYFEDIWVAYFAARETAERLITEARSGTTAFDHFKARYASWKVNKARDQQRFQEIEARDARIRELGI
ncbi:uncharacterized protein [Euphorbia lathyris]|uniref:uncharacterized protein n=1 Tax=Euphorbia lathyris TaxID=212925 RepID=UPI003313DA46